MATLLYRAARRLLQGAFWCMGGLQTLGAENMPPDGPLIVACNHASYLDPMLMGAAFTRDFHFMARRTLFDNPLFGWLIRQTQAFPLDRGGDSRDALRQFGALLAQNRAVLLFPEGTRTRTGRLGEVKPGVGLIAVRSNAPVLPVYIWGSFQSWPRGRGLPRPHRFKCVAGPLITPQPDASRKEEQARITALVDSELHRLEGIAWHGENKSELEPQDKE